jgi:hypothetical protein
VVSAPDLAGSHGHAAKLMFGQVVTVKGGERGFSVRRGTINRKPLLTLLLLGPALAGCSGAPDFLSKDADWFSRSGRVFIRNVSIETPPLSASKPVTADELVSGEGGCPGMAPGADANALADGAAGSPPPSTTGTVALGHTECDVVRGIGAPHNVNLSNNARGDRLAVINYSRGQRAGIYTFTAGRLTSIERGPEPVAPPRAAKPKKKPAA